MARWKRTGTLQGTDTVDTVVFTVDLPAAIPDTASAKGSGDDRLRVRCGQQLGPTWARVHDFKLPPGPSRTETLRTDPDGTLPLDDRRQDIRTG